MTPLGPHVVIGRRSRCAVAAVAFASIGLAAGCSSVQSIDDASPAAAASAVESGEAPIVTAATVPTRPPSLPTLQDLLAQDRFVALGVALERSGLDKVLDGLDDFVLLAPTDAAFASSGADIGIEYSTLMNDPRLLEAVLRYHVVADASTNQSWRTLNGAALTVDGSDVETIERFDGVEVVDRIPLLNGTVFVMPRLLLPASESFVSGTETQDDG